MCTGFASKNYTPNIKGLQSFKGKWYHSAAWPEDKVDLKGKKVAVVGTGASGVQLIQELGPQVGHLTVYQRTPNLAIPMRQVNLNDDVEKSGWQFPNKQEYEEIFRKGHTTFGGHMCFAPDHKFIDATPQERRDLYESLWNKGGFAFWLAIYTEIFFDQDANTEVYDFWCDKIRARINDPIKKEILAPKIPPHAWGTKRVSLEQNYFEVFNQQNVDIINIRESPIIEITQTGIRTEKEGVVDVDVIIFATGFDAVSGGILKINTTNGLGKSLKEKWSHGISSNLGMTTTEFPNMFWLYGPQAPTGNSVVIILFTLLF
jgi:cyclohexanone monooxygenase